MEPSQVYQKSLESGKPAQDKVVIQILKILLRSVADVECPCSGFAHHQLFVRGAVHRQVRQRSAVEPIPFSEGLLQYAIFRTDSAKIETLSKFFLG